MSDTLSRAKKLFELGAHLGHRKNRLHPRARKFVYQIIDGVSIIDLEQTVGQIDAAKAFLKKAGADDMSLLVCATKKTIAPIAAKLATEANAHYITNKWLPGLFTNFDTIAKNVKKLKTLKEQKIAGEWSKFVKHEQVALEKEMKKLERLYAGIVSMSKTPDLILIIDTKREKNSVTESTKINIPRVAIVDTNCNPDEITYPVVINDDTPQAVEAVLTELLSAYKRIPKVTAPVAPKPAAPVVAPLVEATKPAAKSPAPKSPKPAAKKAVVEKPVEAKIVVNAVAKTDAPKSVAKKAPAKKKASK
ncbi:MAG: 30S ribosomal protein S2 [Candidatus Roizmanbacteria bacterium]